MTLYIGDRLKLEGEELAKYGPSKPLDQQGIDKYAEASVQKGANYNEDPTGRRTGQCMCNVEAVLYAVHNTQRCSAGCSA